MPGSQGESTQLYDGSSGTGVFPTIAYQDGEGTEYTIRGSLVRPLSRLKPGMAVGVIYPVGYPNQGVLNTWYELFPVPFFFGAMLLAFLVVVRRTW